MKLKTNRKRIMVVVECCDYNYLQKCHTPNINSLDPHPAISWGGTTRASVPALLGGFLPRCALQNCQKHNLDMTSAYFLTDYYKKGTLFLYAPNGWFYELIRQFMSPTFKKKWWQWHNNHQKQPTKQMVQDFLSRIPYVKSEYFAYFHVMETHSPFYPPDTPLRIADEGSPEWHARRKAALEYVDEAIGPLLKVECDDLIVTSDHNLAHNDPSNFDTFKVFLATRIKK